MLAQIDKRLEVLEGLLIAFLNLDRVIDIIRYDEDPKAALMREQWGQDFVRATSEADYRSPGAGDGELTENQAEAILNMRLRSLRRLEEMALRTEQDALMAERQGLEDLLETETLQWDRISDELKEVRKTFGKTAEGGARRTDFAEAGETIEVPIEAMIEREPITVVLSQMGWARAMKGHIDLKQELKFRDGDGPRYALHAETTDKLLIFGNNGRFYTISATNLPGGRGMGEPVRLMADMPNEVEIVELIVHRPDNRLLVASSAGDGFVPCPRPRSSRRRAAGKQVLNVKDGDVTAKVCRPIPARGHSFGLCR